MTHRKTSKNGLLIGAACGLTVIAVICYGLADRYLIRHVEGMEVEVSLVSAQAEGSGNTAVTVDSTSYSSVSGSSNNASPGESASTAASSLGTAAASSVSTTNSTTTSVFSVVTHPDWTASTGESSVAIEKVVKGTGSNTITYYVAEVLLNNGTALKSAFADGLYGRNIIEYTSVIAKDNNALFAINGDYYGFRSDGIIIRNGVIYRDSGTRTGLAIYKDGTMKVYDETQTTASELLANGVWNTLSFGPALVVDGAVQSFDGTVAVDTNIGNHSIQDVNPRTGIGMISENHFVFIVVDGRSSGYSRGMTLIEFANLFDSYGCTQAYNLDGGGSSTMVFQGEVINNPLGKNQERGTSDILYISE